MFSLKCIFLWIIVANCCSLRILAMRCEDNSEKIYYGSEDSFGGNGIFKVLKEMKNTIDDMNSRLTIMPESKTTDLRIFDIRYDTLPERCPNSPTPRSCAEATSCTRRSGYYLIRISEFSNETFLVQCDAHKDDGDWTVIQRRQDGSVDFYRTWSEYKDGFGDVNGEFFIGLEKLYVLTNFDGPQELVILMENATHKAQVKYDSFSIGSESEKYKLKSLGRFTGNAGDSLRLHLGSMFSTNDQDNDEYVEGSCSQVHMGAWWYKHCHQSNLNGHYGDLGYAKGINWFGVTGYYTSLKYVQMMIRRQHN